MPLSTSDLFNQSLLKFKQQLTRKLMVGFAICCIIALPVSLYRWFEIGFQFIFLHHILLTIITLVSFFRAKKTSYKVDSIIMVSLLSSIIVSGTLAFGLQSGTITFAVFCSCLIVFIWGFYAALAYAVLWCCYLIVVGYLYANSYIAFTVEPNVYEATMGAWITVALGSTVTIAFMLIMAKKGFVYFSNLVEKIAQQTIEIEHLANTDALTGFSVGRLANPMLSQTINLAARDNSAIAVVFVDLNKFKDINDRYGHDAGDYILKESASRMKACLREMDITLRIGGDEFLLIIPNVTNKQEVKIILQRFIDSWSQPLIYENVQLQIAGSMGISMYPEDATTAKDLRRKADVAMYFAKNNDLAYKFYS